MISQCHWVGHVHAHQKHNDCISRNSGEHTHCVYGSMLLCGFVVLFLETCVCTILRPHMRPTAALEVDLYLFALATSSWGAILWRRLRISCAQVYILKMHGVIASN